MSKTRKKFVISNSDKDLLTYSDGANWPGKLFSCFLLIAIHSMQGGAWSYMKKKYNKIKAYRKFV